jgi:hypothetical protein
MLLGTSDYGIVAGLGNRPPPMLTIFFYLSHVGAETGGLRQYYRLREGAESARGMDGQGEEDADAAGADNR